MHDIFLTMSQIVDEASIPIRSSRCVMVDMRNLLKVVWTILGVGIFTLVSVTYFIVHYFSTNYYLLLGVLTLGFLPYTLFHRFLKKDMQHLLFMFNVTLIVGLLFYIAPYLEFKIFFFTTIFAVIFKKKFYFFYTYLSSVLTYLLVFAVLPDLKLDSFETAVNFCIFLAYVIILYYVSLVMMRYEKKDSLYTKTAQALIIAIEAKDKYTQGHSIRVSDYAVSIGRCMKEAGYKIELDTLKVAALLHDIGKINIPSKILEKEGSLTDQEYNTIKKHPVYGYETAKDMGFQQDILEAILYHHERIDGTGYPNRLVDKEIPLFAKIIAIADTFDALTSNRPYRAAFSPEAAREIILENAGKQFDEHIAVYFKESYPYFLKMLNKSNRIA
ncbi:MULTISPECIES: HD-GYP domain-containing protein [unclassified Bacillus (in: firmicutes)]|uniref:HD-GYP domain-containing protein n=1 Tax=unclassified Bacillus (in: firmicutes) TaxID=185979 RepID=UPI000B8096D7|nr:MULTISPECIES: HD-GYP domain-containing protein [unclassified Bacillus (in: firmicutes)]